MTTPVSQAAPKPALSAPKAPAATSTAPPAAKMHADGLTLSKKPEATVLMPEISKFEAITRKSLTVAGIAGCAAATLAVGFLGVAGFPVLTAGLMTGACVLAAGLMGVLAWGVIKTPMGKQD